MATQPKEKRQKLASEPLMVKTITIKDYFRPSISNMMLVWGVPRSKVKAHLDWAQCTTKSTYRVVTVRFKCHRTKCPTLDVNVLYREDLPREGKQPRGAEELGMFIVTELMSRLKQQNMLQLGNKVVILPIQGRTNTFRLEIAPSLCPYCEQAMETGDFVECEGCDTHAHKQCVPTIWADDELQKVSSGAAGSAAVGQQQQPFKFACPMCEAREPAVSYSETCTMQTTQNGHHAPSLRAGINPLKRPFPGIELPPAPSQLLPQLQQQQQAGTDAPGISSQPGHTVAAVAARGESAAQKLHNLPGPGSHPVAQPSPAPGAANKSSGSGPVASHVAELRALGNSDQNGNSATAAGDVREGLAPSSTPQQQQPPQHQVDASRKGEPGEPQPLSSERDGEHGQCHGTPTKSGGKAQLQQPVQRQSQVSGGSGKHRAHAVPPGPPPLQLSPAPHHTPSAPSSGRGPSSRGATNTPPLPSSTLLGTPATNGGKGTLGTADVAARIKAPDSQRSANIIARMSKLKQDADEYIAEIEGLREEMDQLRKALAASQAGFAASQAERAASQASQESLQAENAQLKEQLATLKAGGTSQADVEAAQKEAAAAHVCAAEANKRAQEYGAQLQELQGQLHRHMLESSAAEESRAAIQIALEQTEATLNLERATAAGQAADLEAYRQRCAALDAELKALEEATLDGME